MQHSVKNIGTNYSEISEARKDKKRFNKDDFFNFANLNKDKYKLIELNNDLYVSTWYSDSLIKDYIKQIN
jgi:hypothetical protein